MRRVLGWAAGLAAGLLATTAFAEPSSYVLEPQAVWTAGEAAPRAGWVVVVQGERIVAVGPKSALALPDGAETIALPPPRR